MPTPSPTPEGGMAWYPDYASDTCKDDGNAGYWESNFFWTKEECCFFDWIKNPVDCLANSQEYVDPSGGQGDGRSVEYYPD